VLLAAARRFGVLLAAVAGITAAISLLAGLALDASPGASLPRGFYLVGCFLLLIGVFSGIRGPVRPKGGDEGRDAVGGMFGIGIFSQGIRKATPNERRDARSTSWLFLWLGLALLVLGVAVDGRTSLLT
jgi:uncharacterized membrane protein HdeD (DUF308 family)